MRFRSIGVSILWANISRRVKSGLCQLFAGIIDTADDVGGVEAVGWLGRGAKRMGKTDTSDTTDTKLTHCNHRE